MPRTTAARISSIRDSLEYIQGGVERSEDARSKPKVMRASGQRITNMPAERLRALAGNRQGWQPQAWGYRDMIGELRFALQFRARALSRAVFFPAQLINGEDEPLPLSLRDDVDDDGQPTERSKEITLPPDLCAAAEAELARLPLDSGFAFTGVWSENQDVAGDCWLHGRSDPDTGEETWQIRSVMDVEPQGNTVTIKDELGQPRRLDLGTRDQPGSEELYRLWVPHPAHPHLADSALNALADTLEDICLIGRELRAAARSRIASNGVWLVPNGMAGLRNTKDDAEDDDDETSPFMRNLQAMFLAPINNEGDPGAVVPGVITGTREDIEIAMKSFLRFAREDSPTLMDKLEKCLGRMGNSLDIPPEVITGMADVNHWTAWQIDASTFRHYLEPSLRMMADSVTVAYLRPNLIAQGFPAAEVARLRVWFGSGGITENPNRRQDAIDAWDRGAISWESFRDALGFGPADKPDAEELLWMVAMKNGMDTATAAAIMQQHAQQAGAPPLPVTPTVEVPSQRALPPATADPAGVGGQGAPSTAPSSVTAAAAEPTHRLDTDTGRALAELERALRADLLAAADAATDRALERAGNRLRSKATRDPQIAASLADVPVTSWACQLGRNATLGLGADLAFLLGEAWSALKVAFVRKLGLAIPAIAERAADLLGGDPSGAVARMVAEMSARVETAWANLRQELDDNAERLVFGDDQAPDDVGELPDVSVPPALIRSFLAEVGGLPETSGGHHAGRATTGEPITGLATGSTVSRELDAAGVETIGYLWVYGVTPQLRKFAPHWALEGERFTSWADPKLHPEPRFAWIGPFYRPGDHRGCMCDYVPAFAVPAYAGQVRERLALPSEPTQWLLDLAGEDDRAGRKGTTAQAVRDRHRAIQDLQARFLAGA